jgi:hypothetical protein
VQRGQGDEKCGLFLCCTKAWFRLPAVACRHVPTGIHRGGRRQARCAYGSALGLCLLPQPFARGGLSDPVPKRIKRLRSIID